MQRARLLGRQVQRQHAVDADRGGPRHERVEAEAIDRVGVGEEHDRRAHVSAQLLHQIERLRQGHAAGERPLGRPLDHRAIGERLRERDAELDDVGAGAIEREHDRLERA